MTNETAPACSCDPYSPTTNCCVSCCTPFFTVFLILEASVLIVLVTFYTIVELKSQKKSLLWRLIFSAGIISATAKVVRLGILVNPATRHKSDMALLFFLNTHQCFGIIGRDYGMILLYRPRKVEFMLPIDAVFHAGTLLNSFKILSACVVVISALAYLIYAILLRKTVYQKRDSHPLFYRIYISAFVTAIFFLIICIVIFVTRDNNTSFHDYIVRHSIYETCYFAQIAALPSGFIVHFIKTKSYQRNAPRLRAMTHPMAGIMHPHSTTTTTTPTTDTIHDHDTASPDGGGETPRAPGTAV